jgi:sulfite reductase beta subunit-like hemoprotein
MEAINKTIGMQRFFNMMIGMISCRDLREERRKQGLEKAYGFMIRVRLCGGISTPEQWLAIDDLATKNANGTIKLTTRQAKICNGNFIDYSM